MVNKLNGMLFPQVKKEKQKQIHFFGFQNFFYSKKLAN